jgi:hypothetical protein
MSRLRKYQRAGARCSAQALRFWALQVHGGMPCIYICMQISGSDAFDNT